MSYIINSTDPFVSIKLTEKGRQKLASGKLNFSYWGIGDSEINYEREDVVDSNPTDVTLSAISKTIRPVDRQPNIKSFITTSSEEPYNILNASNVKVIKAVVNNAALERGFFNLTGSTYNTQITSTYARSSGTIANTAMTGGTVVTISSGITREIGDVVLIKVANDTIGTRGDFTNDTPLPNLWFKVQNSDATTITVDRELPNMSTQTGSTSQIIVYRGGEVYESIATGNTTAYWNSNTLEFDSCCDVSCDDVPVWNMNSVWCENLAGMSGTPYEDYTKFGSYTYLGTKNPYLEYLCYSTASTATHCDGPGISYLDDVSKSVAILHYTNNTISSYYGEFFHIDGSNDKIVKVHTPDLMYHRRDYSTGSGTTMGMTFIASGSTNLLGTSDIEYIDLIEDPTMVSGTALVVGRVYPQLKMIVIHDDEIVAAMSYKGNRNWTLPALSATLSSPTGGTSTGVLDIGETMYLTYILESETGTGLTTSLPCQKYIKLHNSTSSIKDVAFKIAEVDMLPYMRKIETGGYDGVGFYAYKFKLLYQIVAEETDRPDPAAWNVYDYTTTAITTVSGQTISPTALENQISAANGFILDAMINSGATTFDLVPLLGLAPNASPEILQFGDERFFYGNIETYIGATIFKTLFDIRVNSGLYNTTSNPTRSKDATTNPPAIRLTEVGIYDSDKELVMIGKLSQPMKLLTGNTITLELSIDF